MGEGGGGANWPIQSDFIHLPSVERPPDLRVVLDDNDSKQPVVGEDGQDVAYVGPVAQEEATLDLPYSLKGGGVDEADKKVTEESCTGQRNEVGCAIDERILIVPITQRRMGVIGCPSDRTVTQWIILYRGECECASEE